MKPGLALGIAGAGAAVLLFVLAYGSRSSSSAPVFSDALRPPLKAGQVVMVTYRLPKGMTQLQAAIAVAAIIEWGLPLKAAEPGDMLDGSKTLSVTARVNIALPKGPPSIPNPSGALVPIAWSVAPPEVIS